MDKELKSNVRVKRWIKWSFFCVQRGVQSKQRRGRTDRGATQERGGTSAPSPGKTLSMKDAVKGPFLLPTRAISKHSLRALTRRRPHFLPSFMFPWKSWLAAPGCWCQAHAGVCKENKRNRYITSKASPVNSLPQNSHLTLRLGQSCCRWSGRSRRVSLTEQRFGHGITLKAQVEKWPWGRHHDMLAPTCWALSHVRSVCVCVRKEVKSFSPAAASSGRSSGSPPRCGCSGWAATGSAAPALGLGISEEGWQDRLSDQHSTWPLEPFASMLFN